VSGLRAALVAVAVLTVAGCGGSGATPSLPGDSGTGAAVSASSSGAAGSPAGASPAAAVVAGYLAYWSALRHAQDTGNPDDPRLPAYATAAALAEAQDGVRTNITRGVRLRGPVGHHPSATLSSTSTATLRDCLDMTRWLAYGVHTGTRDRSVGTLGRIQATYRLVRVGGAWKVASVTQGTDC